MCPIGGYTDDENLFHAQLSLPFHFDLCIISPYGKPPIVLGLKHSSGNESHMSGTSLRTAVFVPPMTEGFPLRYLILKFLKKKNTIRKITSDIRIGTIKRCKIIFFFLNKIVFLLLLFFFFFFFFCKRFYLIQYALSISLPLE